MSTRSGKRIHISFHENTEKSEGLVTSVQKTKSKQTESPKLKRRNYVAYPSEEDSGVDAADGRGDGKTTRVLRKDVLKERNVRTSTESIEPAVDARKSVRSTRRTRKFAEDASEAPQNEEPSKVELSKPKKEKKKKKKAEKEQITEVEEVMVPKKKSKKKKGRRSGSLIVEDIVPESNNLNKSNMSVDSFHSAAGSPRNTDNERATRDLEQAVDAITSTSENNFSKSESRKTRSSLKLENTLTNEIITKEEPRKRTMSVKMNCEDSLNEANGEIEKDTPNKLKTSIKNTVSTVGNIKIDDREEKLPSARKSIRNIIDKTITPNKVNIIEDEQVTSAKGKKRKSIVDDNEVKEDLKADDLLNTIFEKEVSESAHKGKKRKSIVDDNNEVKEDLKADDLLNTTFEKEVSDSAHKGKKRKSAIKASIKIAEKISASPANSTLRKSANETIVKNLESNENKSIDDATFDKKQNLSPFKSSSNISEMETQKVNTTYEKDSADSDSIKEQKKSIIDATFDLTSSPFNSVNEVLSPMKSIDKINRKSVINTIFEKDNNTDQDNKIPVNTTFDKDATESTNTTFEKVEADIKEKRKSLQRLSTQKINSVDSTIDLENKKLDTTFDKNSKSSLISSDNSMITLDKSDASRISITSDESKENILNTTPLLIESSLDESQLNTTKTHSETKTEPTTPLKREGTFTKDEPAVSSPKPRLSVSKTPTKCISLPSPGFTPFHVNKSSTKEKSVLLNVTRSIEKRRSSLVEPPRTTKVMFCSPVDNPALLTQNRKKVIKSNLKGSNKSFVFNDSVSVDTRPSNRKRSYTHNDADEARVKRKRLADELQQSVDRLSRPRTSSAAKLAEPTTPSKKPTTPSKKSDAKKAMLRTKLPNFAAMHQKQFNKMESLDECQERRAKRAKQLLTPNGATNMLERISPKDKSEKPEPQKPKEAPKKPETPIKSLPTFKSLNPGYTRFGFKLNLDVNPFSIPSKTQPNPKENKPNNRLTKPILPSLTGASSVRREVAKQKVMREKSFTDRGVKRTENRHVIKGVRTNRRFELQMRMRDM